MIFIYNKNTAINIIVLGVQILVMFIRVYFSKALRVLMMVSNLCLPSFGWGFRSLELVLFLLHKYRRHLLEFCGEGIFNFLELVRAEQVFKFR